jgi:hypothetical protein
MYFLYISGTTCLSSLRLSVIDHSLPFSPSTRFKYF